MFNNKKLEYITVRYDCSDELAERICVDFDIEANNNSFLCINSLFIIVIRSSKRSNITCTFTVYSFIEKIKCSHEVL